MNLFLDANILVDVALRRIDEKGAHLWVASTVLLDEIYKGKNSGSMSLLSLHTVHVLINPKDTNSGDIIAKEKLRGFRSFLKTVDLTDDLVAEALKEERLMFEDAIQFVSAKKMGANAIVTRDRHFSRVKEEIEILTTEQILAQ